jgi:dTDP-4-amino-4,6-dideoxygalactose transaminase
MYRGLPSAARDRLPVAADAAARVLCLPIYPGLDDIDLDRVITMIARAGDAPSAWESEQDGLAEAIEEGEL